MQRWLHRKYWLLVADVLKEHDQEELGLELEDAKGILGGGLRREPDGRKEYELCPSFQRNSDWLEKSDETSLDNFNMHLGSDGNWCYITGWDQVMEILEEKAEGSSWS